MCLYTKNDIETFVCLECDIINLDFCYKRHAIHSHNYYRGDAGGSQLDAQFMTALRNH